jgi:hypothetical protein
VNLKIEPESGLLKILAAQTKDFRFSADKNVSNKKYTREQQ